MNKRWVVFKPSRYGGIFAEEYWTGGFTDKGNPAQTNSTHGAKKFMSAAEAYKDAGQHKRLNWWRVGKRAVEPVH